nr:MAG TPA: hypothetical protein [Caudoviricetes sp.]
MKKYVNGEYIDMTAEEVAKMQQSQPGTVLELTNDKKLELMLAAIPEEPMPDSESKLGYKWQPMYTPSSGFAWELVEDPMALGTRQNPWYWVEGMAVKTGHHYTSNGVAVYIALEDGVPPTWADLDWFMEVEV